jgi:LysR family hydrogen peroxide-inducible transcriptional activator
MITLRQLRYFDALARHRHFGQAADECAVTQPALSMQIRELETELGVRLVERRPGDVGLTEVGSEVWARAGHILSAARDLTEFARHRARMLTGPMRLGVIPSLAPYLLPRVLPELQRSHPELRLELHETRTKTLLTELGRGALDAVMLALPVDDPEIEAVPLFADRFMLALPASDPLPPDARAVASDVNVRRLILLEEGHCLRDQTLAYCSALPRDAAARNAAASLGATSLATVMQMVANGYGATLVPEIAIETEVRDARIKLIRFADPEPGRIIGLAWRATSPRKADFVALGRIIMDAVGAKAVAA